MFSKELDKVTDRGDDGFGGVFGCCSDFGQFYHVFEEVLKVADCRG